MLTLGKVALDGVARVEELRLVREGDSLQQEVESPTLWIVRWMRIREPALKKNVHAWGRES